MAELYNKCILYICSDAVSVSGGRDPGADHLYLPDHCKTGDTLPVCRAGADRKKEKKPLLFIDACSVLAVTGTGFEPVSDACQYACVFGTLAFDRAVF